MIPILDLPQFSRLRAFLVCEFALETRQRAAQASVY